MTRAGHRESRASTGVALGFALMALNIYWITVIEVRWYMLDVTSLPIFITPIFTANDCTPELALESASWHRAVHRRGADGRLHHYRHRDGVCRARYVAESVRGDCPLQRYETPETGWRERFMGYVPHALFVWDEDTVRGFYNGGVSPYRSDWLLSGQSHLRSGRG